MERMTTTMLFEGYLPPHIPQWAIESGHYEKYMESLDWRTKRRKILKRAKGKCEVCAIHIPQHVHHTTYDRLFFERLIDLIAVCFTCHSLLHPGNDNLAELSVKDVIWIDPKAKVSDDIS
jgi:hypothetical protein